MISRVDRVDDGVSAVIVDDYGDSYRFPGSRSPLPHDDVIVRQDVAVNIPPRIRVGTEQAEALAGCRFA
eukprot:scaffold4049_cov153-Pinguiococcus_pyrenoidosus.AAC.1